MEIITPSSSAPRPVTAYGSTGVTAQALFRAESAAVTVLRVAPAGEVGSHPAPVAQLLLVTAGSGQVRSGFGRWHDLTAGDAVRWSPGEPHTTRSDSGLTAVVVEIS